MTWSIPVRPLLVVMFGLLMLVFTPSHASGPDPCKGNLQGCGATTVTETERDFQGTIIVPGSEAANRAVASNGGCEGCVWTLVVDCDRNAVDSPSYVNCNAARCPDAGTAYRIYLQRPADENPAYLDTICLSPTRRIVTPADLAVDVERYLTNLAPPAPTITTQPEERAVVGLATYFAANGPVTDSTTLDVVTAAGPATLRIEIAPTAYAWTFGDGATCDTATAGGPYDGGGSVERCDDRVAHLYGTPGERTVTLLATWNGTYTFDVGYGQVGPLPIPGDGVAGSPAERTIGVREARAHLIGG